MKTIHLIASDLAKLTGHNTYEPLQNTIDKILVRNKLSSKYIPKSNLEQQLLGLSPDIIVGDPQLELLAFQSYTLT